MPHDEARERALACTATGETAYSDYVATVLLVDMVEHLRGTSAASALDDLVRDNRIDSIRYEFDTNELADPLATFGFYGRRTGGRTIPLYHDATANIANANRAIFGAYATTKGLCTFYRRVGGLLRGDPKPHFPSPEFLTSSLRENHRRGYDTYFNKDCEFSCGFMRCLDDHGLSGLSPSTIGHTGVMGAPFGFYDPDQDLAVSVILNGLPSSESELQSWKDVISEALRPRNLG